jgi:hypothetical protein
MGRAPPKVIAKKQKPRDNKKPALKGQSYSVLRSEIKKIAEKTGEKYGLRVAPMLYQLTLNGVVIDDFQSCSAKGLRNKVREAYYEFLVADDEVMAEVDNAIEENERLEIAIDEVLFGDEMDVALAMIENE